jgi:hypothetical protein
MIIVEIVFVIVVTKVVIAGRHAFINLIGYGSELIRIRIEIRINQIVIGGRVLSVRVWLILILMTIIYIELVLFL